MAAERSQTGYEFFYPSVRKVLLLAGVALGLSFDSARADESGVSFWIPGQYGSLAAVAPAPGWALPTSFYHYSGDAEPDAPFTIGDSVVASLSARVDGLILAPTYVAQQALLGARVALSLGWMPAYTDVEVDVRIRPAGLARETTDSLTGGSDLFPLASLYWQDGDHNWMGYATGAIPVGAYDPTRLANIGLGHGAIDLGGAYTYLNENTGREFSATLGFTYNFENPDTDYKNGIDSHLDIGVSQFLSEKLQLGAVGYAYYQLTGDSGSGAVVGPFKARVAGLGPQLGYTFDVGRAPLYVNLRGYWEFAAKHRLEGFSLFVQAAITF